MVQTKVRSPRLWVGEAGAGEGGEEGRGETQTIVYFLRAGLEEEMSSRRKEKFYFPPRTPCITFQTTGLKTAAAEEPIPRITARK